MGSTVENLLGRVLCVLAVAGLCLVTASAAAAAAPPSFTWKGEGSASETLWEVGANWVGGVAPEEEEATDQAVVQDLRFPELSASACVPEHETKACYHSENNDLTVSAEGLEVDDGDNYVLSGSEELKLGKGGLTASPEGHASGARDELAMGLELTEPQTWHIVGAGAGGNGVLLEDEVLEAGGAAGGLHIVQSKEAALVLGPKAEVELGPVTIEGEDAAAKAGFENGTVELQGNELNWWYEQPVTLKHTALVGFGKVGELATEGAEVQIGSGEHLDLEASDVALDASSKLAFQITGGGDTPGTDYSQLESEGPTELDGATLAITVASPGAGKPCPTLTVGREYTLIEAELFGSVSGEFGNAPEGAEVPIHYGAGCAVGTAEMLVHYHEGTVTGIVMDKQKEKEEAEAKKKHEEEEVKKHEEEVKRDEEAVAQKKHEEEAAKEAAKKHEEEVKQEEAAAGKKHEEEAKRAEQEAAAKKKQEEEAAAKKKQEEKTTQSAPKPFPDATIVGTSLSVNPAGAFAVKIKCPAGETSCTGTITLRTLGAVVANASAAKAKHMPKAAVLTLASGSFTVAGGQTKTVTLRLTAAGKKLLAHSQALSARATIVAHDPAGATNTGQTVVTLRAQKSKRKKK